MQHQRSRMNRLPRREEGVLGVPRARDCPTVLYDRNNIEHATDFQDPSRRRDMHKPWKLLEIVSRYYRRLHRCER